MIPVAVIFGLMGVVFLGACFGACKDKAGEGESKAKIKWPEKPADGCPVAVKVLELLEPGTKGPRARMRVFNFSEKKVERLSMTLHYQDGNGKEIKTFPHTQMWPGGVAGKSHDTFKGGMFMPQKTKKVVVDIEKVVFSGGEVWQATK
jgi:hypothetical protein